MLPSFGIPLLIKNSPSLLINLISYWKLDGNLLDSKGTNHGTLTLLNTLNATNGTYTASKINQGVLFSNASVGGQGGGAISCGTSSALDTKLFSAAAWIYPTQLGYDTYTIFARTQGGNGDNFRLRLATWGGTTADILAYQTTSFTTVSTQNNNVTGPVDPILVNTWSHVAVTRDSSHVVKLYHNGVLVANSVTPATGASYIGAPANQFTIGSDPDLGSASWNAFIGRIDEVGYWNKVLTPTEVASLYNSGVGLSYPF